MTQVDAVRSQRGLLLLLGLAASGVGAYFTLVGLDVLPPPSRQGGPGWIVVCAGLVFMLGGMAALVQAVAGADDQGELPADTSRWVRVIQHLVALGIGAGMATIGTWIALAGRAEQFGSSGFGLMGTGVMIARIAFGIGAVIMWLYVVAVARRTLQLLLNRSPS